MKFTKLRIHNFLTVGDSGDLLLAERGLNLLQGVNDDDPSATSNGAGKSSVPDALCWALFGTTARGESGDAVVNRTAGKDTKVEVVLLDGDTVYTIARHRKHKIGKNTLTLTFSNSAGTTGGVLTKGTDKETQVEVERIIGCSYEVFKAAIYAGQEEMPDLPGMTDKQLKMLIEEAAGVQLLERAYEIARAEFNGAQSQLQDLNRQTVTANNDLGLMQVRLEATRIKHKEFEDAREGVAQGHAQASNDAKLAAAKMVQGLQKMDEAGVVARLTQIATDLAAIGKIRKDADDYQRTVLQPKQQAVTTAKTMHANAVKEAQRVRATYDNAEQELAKPCGACGKPHTPDELEQFRSHTKTLLTQRVAEAQEWATKVEAAESTVAMMVAEHTRLLGLVPDASALSSEQGTLNTRRLEIERLKGAARAKVAEAQQLLAKVEEAKTAPNPQASALQMMVESIDKLEKQMVSLKERHALATKDYGEASAVVQVFSPAGVRAHILDTVTPFLNERTSEYLGTLSDGNISATWSTLSKTAKGELREKFCIDVSNDKGAESFKGLSGGEKRKVRLSTMMALQDLVASRATKPISLWVGDEIDDALDESGLERLMTILERKARDRGTVLIISHNSLRDWCDNVTTVRKTGGYSTVEGALCAT